MRMRVFAACVLFLLGGMVVAAAPAAAGVTTCHNTSDGNIKHGLIVKSGHSCVFSGIVREGVVVEPGAGLFINKSHVQGQVVVGSGAFFTFGYSHLTDGVTADHANLVYGYNSAIDGSMVGSMTAGVGNYGEFHLGDSAVRGRITLTQGGSLDVNVATSVIHTTVAGGATFISIGAYVLDSTIGQQLTFDGPALSAHPSAVCASTISGNVTVRHSAGPAGVGSGLICEHEVAGLTVHGSVYINDNPGRVHVAGAIDGDLVCHGNAHHPTQQPSGRLFGTLGGRAVGQCSNYPNA